MKKRPLVSSILSFVLVFSSCLETGYVSSAAPLRSEHQNLITLSDQVESNQNLETLFDSRDSYFRSPSGAVEENTEIHFKIRLPRNLNCSAVRLSLINDDTKSNNVRDLFWCGQVRYDYEEWECHFTPNDVGLYWYNFEIDTAQGKRFINKRYNDSKGEMSTSDGSRWQITVYEKGFETPEWMTGGTIYQIFPDRFNDSGEEKQDVPDDRYLHDNWDDVPLWNEDGNHPAINEDYYGGDLKGIEQKLDYLQDLGITCIYLNPIFEAHSNHRYNTADYSKIDPLLGNEEDFKSLCKSAKEKGIKIILDGVFNHTGSDSIYFNKNNRYDSVGAYNSQSSPYYNWYNFIGWRDWYESWWNYNTLPKVKKENAEFNEFINGENGIIRKWLRLGASGWRLDVLDELPDGFIENLRKAVKAEDSEAILLGEVWEDASNKEENGKRRRYLLGQQMDSVMNYPFRNAILGFLKGENTGSDSMNTILSIVENYPPQVLNVLMNNIGTHDTARAITELAGESSTHKSREWQANAKLSDEQKATGIKLMKLASAMQYTLPGVPSLYYGDEALVEGYKDPFCRTTYPWGNENQELLDWHKGLGYIRQTCAEFKDGNMKPIYSENNLMAYTRGDDILCVFNASRTENKQIRLPESFKENQVVLGCATEGDTLTLEPLSCSIIKKM